MTCRVFHLLTKKEQYYWLFNIELVDTCWRKNRRFYLSVITLLFVAVAFYIFFFFIFALLFLVIVQFDRIPKLEWNGKRQQLSYFLFLYVWRSFREKSLSDFHLFPFSLFWGWIFMIQFSISFVGNDCWRKFCVMIFFCNKIVKLIGMLKHLTCDRIQRILNFPLDWIWYGGGGNYPYENIPFIIHFVINLIS